MSLLASLRTMRILWGCLLASVGIYVVLVFFDLLQRPERPVNEILLPVFAGMGISMALVSFVMPAVIYRQIVVKSGVAVVNEPAPEAFSASYRQAASGVKVFADPAAALRTAIGCFQTRLILSLAFSESIAIFGLTAVMLGNDKLVGAPFFAASALLMLLRLSLIHI